MFQKNIAQTLSHKCKIGKNILYQIDVSYKFVNIAPVANNSFSATSEVA
jgi:hypothetical protein